MQLLVPCELNLIVNTSWLPFCAYTSGYLCPDRKQILVFESEKVNLKFDSTVILRFTH